MSTPEKSPAWIAEKLPGFAWEQVRQVAVAPVCGCLVRANLLGEAAFGLPVIGREEGEVARAVQQVEEKVQVLSGWISRTDDVVGMETVLTDKALTTAELQQLLAESPFRGRPVEVCMTAENSLPTQNPPDLFPPAKKALNPRESWNRRLAATLALSQLLRAELSRIAVGGASWQGGYHLGARWRGVS